MTIALPIILGLLFIAYATFAVFYFARSPWSGSWQGITLESQKVTMAALVGYFLVEQLFPGFRDWEGREVLLLVLLVFLLVEAYATLAGLLIVQNAHRPVTRRRGAGFAHPEDIERTTPPRRRKP